MIVTRSSRTRGSQIRRLRLCSRLAFASLVKSERLLFFPQPLLARTLFLRKVFLSPTVFHRFVRFAQSFVSRASRFFSWFATAALPRDAKSTRTFLKNVQKPVLSGCTSSHSTFVAYAVTTASNQTPSLCMG